MNNSGRSEHWREWWAKGNNRRNTIKRDGWGKPVRPKQPRKNLRFIQGAKFRKAEIVKIVGDVVSEWPGMKLRLVQVIRGKPPVEWIAFIYPVDPLKIGTTSLARELRKLEEAIEDKWEAKLIVNVPSQ